MCLSPRVVLTPTCQAVSSGELTQPKEKQCQGLTPDGMNMNLCGQAWAHCSSPGDCDLNQSHHHDPEHTGTTPLPQQDRPSSWASTQRQFPTCSWAKCTPPLRLHILLEGASLNCEMFFKKKKPKKLLCTTHLKTFSTNSNR